MSEAEDESVTFEFTFRPPDGSQVVLRQVALGYQPLILIEPEERDGEAVFNVDSTFLDREELADVLELAIMALKQGRDEEDDDSDEREGS